MNIQDIVVGNFYRSKEGQVNQLVYHIKTKFNILNKLNGQPYSQPICTYDAYDLEGNLLGAGTYCDLQYLAESAQSRVVPSSFRGAE